MVRYNLQLKLNLIHTRNSSKWKKKNGPILSPDGEQIFPRSGKDRMKRTPGSICAEEPNSDAFWLGALEPRSWNRSRSLDFLAVEEELGPLTAELNTWRKGGLTVLTSVGPSPESKATVPSVKKNFLKSGYGGDLGRKNVLVISQRKLHLAHLLHS